MGGGDGERADSPPGPRKKTVVHFTAVTTGSEEPNPQMERLFARFAEMFRAVSYTAGGRIETEMGKRKRPQRSVTLDTTTIAFVDEHARRLGISFSEAVDRIVQDYAADTRTRTLTHAVGTGDDDLHARHLPGLVRPAPATWTGP